MSTRTLAPAMLALGLALACDPRGVSLGTEELCVPDAELAAAATDSNETVSTCARIGENQLVNAGFETPVVACVQGNYCQFAAAEVEGWQTTSVDQVIEVWHSGHYDVPAPSGSQFVELDATSRDTLWQDLALPPGQLMYWSFLHRGRNVVERTEVLIGPPDAEVSQGVFSSAVDTWSLHSGLYRVGNDEPPTRFALVSRTGIMEGNLIDAVVFAPVD